MLPTSSEGTVLVGNISHRQHKRSYLCWRVAYVARQHKCTQSLEKIEFFKRSQMEKLST
jgi:hypothetical protein